VHDSGITHAGNPSMHTKDVIQRVLRVLMRRSKNNAVLVGEAGVGKTAIAEGIAQILAGPSAPAGFQGKRMVSLDAGSLVAGTQYRGAFEERLQAVLTEVRAAKGGIVLFVDEMHMLVSAGRTDGSMDAANLLKPALARGELHCLGATTPEEYRNHIESDPAFARRFQPVHVEEPSVAEAALWLYGLRDRYQVHHQVEISDCSIEAAVCFVHAGNTHHEAGGTRASSRPDLGYVLGRSAKRFLPQRRLPDSAIDVLDEAASSARLLHSAPQVRTGVIQSFFCHTSTAGDCGPDSGHGAVCITPRPRDVGPPIKGQTEGAATPALGSGAGHHISSQAPRPCPHCAMPVTWQPAHIIQLQCPACNFRFLNVAPEQLMLGCTVLRAPLETKSGLQKPRPHPAKVDAAAQATGGTVGRADVMGSFGPPLENDAVLCSKDPCQAGDGVLSSDVGATPDATKGEKVESVGAAQPPKHAGRPRTSHNIITIKEKDVLEIVSLMTGIPVGDMSSGEHERLANIEAALSKKVVGQLDAVRVTSAAVRIGRLGFGPMGRPSCALLFTGPPGVGKTLLAEQLGSIFYGGSDAIVRLSGSDLSERASVSRLLGPPPGYVGFGRGGELTEPVRRRPHSLLIIDNVEAAHPEVQELFAHVLETGKLKDSTGRVADFTNSMIVFTARAPVEPQGNSMMVNDSAQKSDLSGGQQLQPQTAALDAGRQSSPDRATTLSSASNQRAQLLPTLLARVDDIVPFHRISTPNMRLVAQIQIDEVCQQVASRGSELQVPQSVVEAIAKAAMLLNQGARPVQQLVRQAVLAPLSQELLKFNVSVGGAPAGSTESFCRSGTQRQFQARVFIAPTASNLPRNHLEISTGVEVSLRCLYP